ncbi:MAG: hypothetical protein M0Q24_11030 [Sulfurimonas sp.]|jgi:hypothetical protein|uniref:hypothetical protein n=1 Tax=Sulfurimonas sp. TaxID=2022749 RepID=UPI0025E2413D|nr:hypothetical protein [Sulfurimonas sp.]MCK9492607.1 hypothetical protein [Sulfurimonas sp.]
MTKKQKQKLAAFAITTAELAGFIKKQGPIWYDYEKQTRAGVLNLTVRDNTESKSAGIDLFMRFDSPDRARAAGFDCNPFSGKYNYCGISAKESIESILQQF